ncbi:glycosyltransferase family 1 protein [Flavobacterium sp. Root186]|uniref:glycosyltransferase family 4 protein n=1 Tax=Flavobacterium sp. Root186 TaxID=1736485 RepID=UPI00070062A3|nr:glycosyltransferase family 1 protein [Flavobacterium sp. Root186]KRB57316.1 glycosyl transferase family 1 [Flavobacterium sp. Root186]
MKILVHPQTFNLQKYGGISRYYTEILSRLSKNNKVQIPLYGTSNVYYNESVLVTFKQKLYSLYIKLLEKLKIRGLEKTRKRNDKFFEKTILKKDFDVFIPTYYDVSFLKLIDSKPFVLTIYDMIYELFPHFFEDQQKIISSISANKLLLMESATRIIAVSENTKRDIIKIYPHIDESKIDVVYHGCSIKIVDTHTHNLPEKYILFVGTRANYKNFIFLVNSIKELLKLNNDLVLLCAGGGEFDNEEKEYLKELNLENQIIQREFKDDELGLYYKNAICFVFPSLYEGFGIPVLESMVCGCPVVLAKHSSFPEVAGEAGVYYEAGNPEDLKNKIYSLVQNPILRNEFSIKGSDQVKKFSWEKAAAECLAVYKKAYKTSIKQ